MVLEDGRDHSRISRQLESRGIKIHRLEAVEPSLEDVFITLVESRRSGIELKDHNLEPGFLSDGGE